MRPDSEFPQQATTRRATLGGTAAIATGVLTGCVQQMRSLANRRTPEPVTLTIRTVPADTDPLATRIARFLAMNLEAVGINVDVILMAEDELRRTVLINHTYDIYVDRYPDHHDPDFLRSLLHSQFSEEPGWQNPFGFSDLDIDSLLDQQRASQGSERESAVFELQRIIARNQPFSIVAFPDEIKAVRTDRYTGWYRFNPTATVNYLTLESAGDGGDNASLRPLRVTTTDDRITKNFNPIAVEFRSRGTFTGLLYDPLARRFNGMVWPWLAESWTWDTSSDENTTVTVRLREDLSWHDGRSVTASDVAFTYRFFADTSMGTRESPVPAPRFRGRISLVTGVDAIDDRTVRLEFGDTSSEVAVRTLTVPVMPKHEWAPKATDAEIAGIELFEGVTDALVWTNPEPIGSGPLQFEQSIAEELLTLSRFDDHFINRDLDGDLGEVFGGGVVFDELQVQVVPSDVAAVELLAADNADATASPVDPQVVPRIGRNSELKLLVQPSRSFYHIGFNVRQRPLGNPRFRRAIARLIDKAHLSDDAFDGYATPAATPLGGTKWAPSDLRWEGTDPEVPFAGTRGKLDVEAAKRGFEAAGFQYSDDGKLLGR